MCLVWFSSYLLYLEFIEFFRYLGLWISSYLENFSPLVVQDYSSSFSSFFFSIDDFNYSYIVMLAKVILQYTNEMFIFKVFPLFYFWNFFFFYCILILRNFGRWYLLFFTKMKKIKNSVCAYIFTFARPCVIS